MKLPRIFFVNHVEGIFIELIVYHETDLFCIFMISFFFSFFLSFWGFFIWLHKKFFSLLNSMNAPKVIHPIYFHEDCNIQVAQNCHWIEQVFSYKTHFSYNHLYWLCLFTNIEQELLSVISLSPVIKLMGRKFNLYSHNKICRCSTLL